MLPAFFSLKKVTVKMPVSNISTDMEELLLQVCKIIKKSQITHKESDKTLQSVKSSISALNKNYCLLYTSPSPRD